MLKNRVKDISPSYCQWATLRDSLTEIKDLCLITVRGKARGYIAVTDKIDTTHLSMNEYRKNDVWCWNIDTVQYVPLFGTKYSRAGRFAQRLRSTQPTSTNQFKHSAAHLEAKKQLGIMRPVAHTRNNIIRDMRKVHSTIAGEVYDYLYANNSYSNYVLCAGILDDITNSSNRETEMRKVYKDLLRIHAYRPKAVEMTNAKRKIALIGLNSLIIGAGMGRSTVRHMS